MHFILSEIFVDKIKMHQSQKDNFNCMFPIKRSSQFAVFCFASNLECFDDSEVTGKGNDSISNASN